MGYTDQVHHQETLPPTQLSINLCVYVCVCVCVHACVYNIIMAHSSEDILDCKNTLPYDKQQRIISYTYTYMYTYDIIVLFTIHWLIISPRG